MSKYIDKVSTQYTGSGGTVLQIAFVVVALAAGIGILFSLWYYPSVVQY